MQRKNFEGSTFEIYQKNQIVSEKPNLSEKAKCIKWKSRYILTVNALWRKINFTLKYLSISF